MRGGNGRRQELSWLSWGALGPGAGFSCGRIARPPRYSSSLEAHASDTLSHWLAPIIYLFIYLSIYIYIYIYINQYRVFQCFARSLAFQPC